MLKTAFLGILFSLYTRNSTVVTYFTVQKHIDSHLTDVYLDIKLCEKEQVGCILKLNVV